MVAETGEGKQEIGDDDDNVSLYSAVVCVLRYL